MDRKTFIDELNRAIAFNDIDTVSELINNNRAELNGTGYRLDWARKFLMTALNKGHKEIAHMLMPIVLGTKHNGLLAAAIKGCGLEEVKALVDAGVSITETYFPKYQTSLMTACIYNKVEIVRYLKSIDNTDEFINYMDPACCTAFDYAVKHKSTSCIRLLAGWNI